MNKEATFVPIDRETWPMAQSFYYYTQMAPTGYSVTVQLNITKMHAALRARGLKFFPAYLYLVTRAVGTVPQLRVAVQQVLLVVLRMRLCQGRRQPRRIRRLEHLRPGQGQRSLSADKAENEQPQQTARQTGHRFPPRRQHPPVFLLWAKTGPMATHAPFPPGAIGII